MKLTYCIYDLFCGFVGCSFAQQAKYFFLGESGFVVFRLLNLRMAFVFCSVFLCVCVCVLDPPLFLWLPGQSCAGWSVMCSAAGWSRWLLYLYTRSIINIHTQALLVLMSNGSNDVGGIMIYLPKLRQQRIITFHRSLSCFLASGFWLLALKIK